MGALLAAWWVQRFRRVGPSGLVDEVRLPDTVSDDDISRVLRAEGEIRYGEWPVEGALMQFLRREIVPAGYISWLRRIAYVYFLGYRADE